MNLNTQVIFFDVICKNHVIQLTDSILPCPLVLFISTHTKRVDIHSGVRNDRRCRRTDLYAGHLLYLPPFVQETASLKKTHIYIYTHTHADSHSHAMYIPFATWIIYSVSRSVRNMSRWSHVRKLWTMGVCFVCVVKTK